MQGPETSPRSSGALRLLVLGMAIIGTLFYAGSIVSWLRIPGARRDGFELIGVALATAYFGVLVLPALIMAIANRWLPFGAILGLIALGLATDAIWPWIPWR